MRSINNISSMRILSKEEGKNGYKVSEKEGEELVVDIITEKMEVGTTVIIEDIFRHTPVRK